MINIIKSIAGDIEQSIPDLQLSQYEYKRLAEFINENFVHRGKIQFEMEKCFNKVLEKES